ncbi:MAG: cell division protein FtsL [Roseinatronobacter sp.]
MRSLLYLVTTLAVIALAAWAYRETHLTQQAINQQRALERDIARLTEALRIQRAEWAFLNRPDRLRELVDVNFDRLPLVPLTGDHFGTIGQIAYPLPLAQPLIQSAIEVSGAIENLSFNVDLDLDPSEVTP